MSELLPVFIATLVLAGFSEIRSVSDKGNGSYIIKEKLFYSIMVVVLALFVGLRIRYNDTTAYTHGYELMSKSFSDIDWAIGANPGFVFTSKCLKIFGASTQSFLMFFAVITITIYFWFIRKYSDNIWLSVFLFMASENYVFTMAAVKQCVAVALCLIATDFAVQRKWKTFIFFVLLACTFHPYAFMYLIVPFLRFTPWTTKTYWMLLIFGCVGIGLESLLGTVIDITSMMGEGYTVDSFNGEGVNIFRLAVVWVPVFISFVVRRHLKKNDDERTNILLNLTILRAEIMFIALFGTANYFARLANYFSMFEIITLPWLFRFFNKRSNSALRILMVAFYLIYFYYAHGIMYGGFDAAYDRVGLFVYLNSLF